MLLINRNVQLESDLVIIYTIIALKKSSLLIIKLRGFITSDEI